MSATPPARRSFLRTTYRVVTTAAHQWVADGVPGLGAALAYYALFSVAPLVILATAIAGLVYGEQAARGQVRAQLVAAVGPDAAGTIQALVENACTSEAGGYAAVVGVVTLFLGALGVFLQLRSALTTIWKLEPVAHGLLGTVVSYAVALAMVILCGAFLVLSLAASTAVAAALRQVDEWLPGREWFWRLADPAVSIVLLTLLLAVLFRVLSAWQLSWGNVAFGAVATSLLFTAGKTLIGYYLATSGVDSVYGAAGSLVALLVWVYYSAQILYFGAELIQARRTLTSSSP